MKTLDYAPRVSNRIFPVQMTSFTQHRDTQAIFCLLKKTLVKKKKKKKKKEKKKKGIGRAHAITHAIISSKENLRFDDNKTCVISAIYTNCFIN